MALSKPMPEQRTGVRPDNVRDPRVRPRRPGPPRPRCPHLRRPDRALRPGRRRGAAAESHGTTPRVSVTIDLEDLINQTGHGTTDTGEDVSGETIRRMACDAEIIPIVLGPTGEVLDVGHQQRLVTPAIWKALVVRDKHCRFPNCTRPPVMATRTTSSTGATAAKPADNMMLLCGHHHRLVHAGPWTIRKQDPTVQVHPPPGTRRMTTHRT